MGVQVTTGAMMECTFGDAPSVLNATPMGVEACGLPAATIADMVPIENVPPFVMCNTPSNPEVAAATAAALGVLTPMPCVPVPAGPWAPGAVSVTIMGVPALTDECMLECAWGGVISITDPGQVAVEST